MIILREIAIQTFTVPSIHKFCIKFILILQMLHIGSGPGLFFILLRQGKEQTVAPLSYIFTLPLLKRLLYTINIPRLKRLQLAGI